MLHLAIGRRDIPQQLVEREHLTDDLWRRSGAAERFLLDIDWTKAATTWLLPVDHPLFLLLARPNQARLRLGDGLWTRLVDVGAALSARTYAGDGSVVLDVRDEVCPWNEGRWRVEGGEASPTDDAADLALDVADLGSVYLGGFSFRELSRAGRVEELAQELSAGSGGATV